MKGGTLSVLFSEADAKSSLTVTHRAGSRLPRGPKRRFMDTKPRISKKTPSTRIFMRNFWWSQLPEEVNGNGSKSTGIFISLFYIGN